MTIANDPRRLFTPAQRLEIFTRASGKCERCGGQLDKETFEAHHKVSHANGGSTHVDNGQALCLACHDFVHRDDIDQRSRFCAFRKSYEWQDRAIDKYKRGVSEFYSETPGAFRKAFIVEVSPSGGKTIFSMKLAREMINAKLIDKVIWVVPRDSIKNGFKDDFKRAGSLDEHARLPGGGAYLSIDCDLASSYGGMMRNMHGAVLTYAALNEKMLSWLQLLSKTKKLLFVFDEAHHGADNDDGDGNEWGAAMIAAEDMACSIVAMTGTPIRADNREIPFLEYRMAKAVDERGNERDVKMIDASSGFQFTYRDAVMAGVARRITCLNVNPLMRYSIEFEGDVDYEERLLSSVPKAHLPKVKHTAICFRRGVVDDMLKKAHSEIERMRRNGDSDAACLVISVRGSGEENALPKIAERIHVLFQEKAVTVESADGDRAATEIKSFKRGTGKWIVAKDMISEGTNLPRVRVVCILRDIGNQTFYEQLVHRATRNDADDRPEDAIVLQLAFPHLVEWGAQLENQVRMIWIPPEQEPDNLAVGNGSENEAPRVEVTGIAAHLETDEEQAIIAGEDFTDTHPVARDLFDQIGQTTGLTQWQLNHVLRAQKERGVDIGLKTSAPSRDEDEQEIIRRKQDELNTLVRRAAMHGADGSYQERARRCWVEVKQRAGVALPINNIARDHPRPLEAMMRLCSAAEEILKFRARRAQDNREAN